MSGAILSPCGRYRYRLWRDLPNGVAGRGVFVMLNPSTADAEVDDKTIRRCTGFAERFGWLRYDVVNLYSIRSTDPDQLPHLANAFSLTGPDYDAHFRAAIIEADVVVCAWSGNKWAIEPGRKAEDLIRYLGKTPLCLGTTVEGAPRHPLYLPGDATLREYRP